jgi:phosphopantothenoylcysteine decarboxylase/phosphopantothenate--cysteine ligase
MNQAMWSNPATRSNVAVLQERGVGILGPAEGEQACGESGPGRMLEPFALVEAVSSIFANGLLAGLKVMVTAGPTREAIDPVRFLSNRSSGKMGYAVAAAARAAGAEVLLVSGPTMLEVPAGVRSVAVETAAEMFEAVMSEVVACDIFIGAAAVADYRPAEFAPQKIKKQTTDWALPLTPVKDVLAAVAGSQPRPFCVGFAAETAQLEQNAHNKRLGKNVDMIAANQVGEGLGFDCDDNELLLLWEDGQVHLPKDNKQRLAVALIEQIAKRYRKSNCSKVEHHAKHSA